MPEHALVSALDEKTLDTLCDALLAAYGPVDAAPETARKTSSAFAVVSRMERDLWQVIPPRAARRLSELCADPSAIRTGVARAGAQRAMRRGGLLACGSLPVAVKMAVAELGVTPPVPLDAPDGLARACAAHPEIADLVILATRPEYAEARWQPATGADLRRPDSGSRFRTGP
jgi:hypothetical protein